MLRRPLRRSAGAAVRQIAATAAPEAAAATPGAAGECLHAALPATHAGWLQPAAAVWRTGILQGQREAAVWDGWMHSACCAFSRRPVVQVHFSYHRPPATSATIVTRPRDLSVSPHGAAGSACACSCLHVCWMVQPVASEERDSFYIWACHLRCLPQHSCCKASQKIFVSLLVASKCRWKYKTDLILGKGMQGFPCHGLKIAICQKCGMFGQIRTCTFSCMSHASSFQTCSPKFMRLRVQRRHERLSCGSTQSTHDVARQ
eukprot:366056-Chlamydomonas_euryale.AAC.4